MECLLTCARQQNIGEGALTRQLRNVDSGRSSATDSVKLGKSPPLPGTWLHKTRKLYSTISQLFVITFYDPVWDLPWANIRRKTRLSLASSYPTPGTLQGPYTHLSALSKVTHSFSSKQNSCSFRARENNLMELVLINVPRAHTSLTLL